MMEILLISAPIACFSIGIAFVLNKKIKKLKGTLDITSSLSKKTLLILKQSKKKKLKS